MVAELGHPVPCVQAGTAEPGLIGGVEQAQIRQFVMGGTVYVLRLLVQAAGLRFTKEELTQILEQHETQHI